MSFLRFWYEFLFGDDPVITVGVVGALAITAAVAHSTDAPAWWIAVAAVLVVLPLSVLKAARRERQAK
jgi:hypothetical protein